MTGTVISMARTGPWHLINDSLSTCRKFLGLKLTHEEVAADVCRNSLQMQHLSCGERPPGFAEIRIRRFSSLMCRSLGMICSHRDCSAKGDPHEYDGAVILFRRQTCEQIVQQV
jgi:hypothetical protein